MKSAKHEIKLVAKITCFTVTKEPKLMKREEKIRPRKGSRRKAKRYFSCTASLLAPLVTGHSGQELD